MYFIIVLFLLMMLINIISYIPGLGLILMIIYGLYLYNRYKTARAYQNSYYSKQSNTYHQENNVKDERIKDDFIDAEYNEYEE